MIDYTHESIKRFYSRVAKTNDIDECWLWTARKTKLGYGLISILGKDVHAHRMAWELTHEEFIDGIPDGMEVCHSCDNPSCCNPNHLFLGTHKQNMEDMANKGRSARGLKNRSNKLTEDQVKEIRERYAKGGITQRQLAEEYGVIQSSISPIITGRSWGWLK